MKHIFLTLVTLFVTTMLSRAAIVETDPMPLQHGSRNVTVTFHADEGTGGLKGLKSGVYAHTGVVTNKSNGAWVKAPTWGDNDAKYALEYVSIDTWRLKIGDIRAYYGLTDPDEVVTKLAFVFRNADCSKTGKNPGETDIFVDVLDDSFAVALESSVGMVLSCPGEVVFTVSATDAADIEVAVNGTTVGRSSSTRRLDLPYTFTEGGDYRVTAKAVCGSETATASIDMLVVPDADEKPYPGGNPSMGAVRGADGNVYFCLAAPQKSSVILVGSWNDFKLTASQAMNSCEVDGQQYFWTSIGNLSPSQAYPYYYLVDGILKVADPYAHLILDCHNDKWLKTDAGKLPVYPYDKFDDTMLAVYADKLDDYDWQYDDEFVMPDKSQLVIYEMLLRDFTGTGGGTGNLENARSHLSYLANMGVNAIELMPIMEFNGNNSWGYNTNFYMAPDKAYGMPEDYKNFIDECHHHGMAVILDIVFNQSDGLHPWYLMYGVDENPFYNKVAPHDYSVLNDWRQEHPLVRRQWEDALRYWLEVYHVDGFRFDLVKGLGDSDSYGSGTESYNASRVANMKRLHDVIKSVKPTAVQINEHLAGAKEESEMASDGQLLWSNMNYASCQTAMGWESGASLNGMSAQLNGNRPWGSTVAYAESHDEERMAYKQIKWGCNDAVKSDLPTQMRRLGSVAAQMLMVPGPKMIWQFGELGADQTTKISNGSGNNTSPKKVVWGYLDDPDRKALQQTYTEMIWLRRKNPALFEAGADARINLGGWSKGRSVVLAADGAELVLMANPSVEDAVTVSVDVNRITDTNIQVISASKGFVPSPAVSGPALSCSVPAGAYVVFGTSDVNGIDMANGGVDVPEVTCVNGRIVINGEYRRASVYDMLGRSHALAAVAPGLYIVTVDGRATKLLVR